MPISQGRLGKVLIGGNPYPVYSWQMTSPRNIQQGTPIGNTWATAKGEGLQSTRFTAQIMCRDNASEVLSTAFWNMFLSRTWGTGFDDTAAQTIVASSGRVSRTLANAKAESFQLVVQKGAVVGLTVSFLAPGIATTAGLTTATSYLNTVDNSNLLMFNQATVGGVTGSAYSMTVNYSNNHLPNAPLDGTKYVQAWEAGIITCSTSLTVAEWIPGSDPWADGSTLTLQLAGTATRLLTLQQVTMENPRDLNVTPGQVFQSVAGIVQGSNTTAPLTIS